MEHKDEISENKKAAYREDLTKSRVETAVHSKAFYEKTWQSVMLKLPCVVKNRPGEQSYQLRSKQ